MGSLCWKIVAVDESSENVLPFFRNLHCTISTGDTLACKSNCGCSIRRAAWFAVDDAKTLSLEGCSTATEWQCPVAVVSI